MAIVIYVGRKARYKGNLCTVSAIHQISLLRNRPVTIELEDGSKVKCFESDLAPDYDKQLIYKD